MRGNAHRGCYYMQITIMQPNLVGSLRLIHPSFWGVVATRMDPAQVTTIRAVGAAAVADCH